MRLPESEMLPDDPKIEIYGDTWYRCELQAIRNMTKTHLYKLLVDLQRAEQSNAIDEMLGRALSDTELREIRGYVRGLRYLELMPAVVDTYLSQMSDDK